MRREGLTDEAKAHGHLRGQCDAASPLETKGRNSLRANSSSRASASQQDVPSSFHECRDVDSPVSITRRAGGGKHNGLLP